MSNKSVKENRGWACLYPLAQITYPFGLAFLHPPPPLPCLKVLLRHTPALQSLQEQQNTPQTHTHTQKKPGNSAPPSCSQSCISSNRIGGSSFDDCGMSSSTGCFSGAVNKRNVKVLTTRVLHTVHTDQTHGRFHDDVEV